MISQTALSRNEARTSVADSFNRRIKGTRDWHSLEAASVTRLLNVNPNQGLTASVVASRRLRYGPNNSEGCGSHRMSGILVLLFLGIVIGFLVIAALLNRAAGDNVELFSILVVVILGAVVGFSYVLRSARALDAMRDATRAAVCVRREGQETTVAGEELVPGDIILLTAGDTVPADARLLETEQLTTKESALTGRTKDVEKRISQIALDTPLEQRQSMVYLGTTINTGRAVAAVVGTGVQTELGKRAAGDN